MDTIRQWALGICIVMVAISLFSMLIPHSRMEKVLQFVISLVFLSCLVVPFFTGMPELTFDTIAAGAADTDVLEEQLREQTKRLSEANISQVVAALLEEKGITAKKIEPDINISEDNSISITNIVVELDDTDAKNVQSVRGLIEEKTGIKTHVALSSER